MLNDYVKIEYILFFTVISIFLIGLYFIMRVHLKKDRLNKGEDILTRLAKKKEKKLMVSESPINITIYLYMLLFIPFIMSILSFFLTKSWLIGIVFYLAGLLVPEMIVKIAERRSKKTFDQRYLRALEQMSASLHSGASILSAVKDVASCKFVHPTIRRRFAKLHAEITNGISIAEAFRHFADTVDSLDAKDVALAIDVQTEIGGKEGDVIEAIANNIKQRAMLQKEINSQFSSLQMMNIMMTMIPYSAYAILLMGSMSYIQIYFTTPILTVLFVIFLLMPLTGAYINQKMISNIKKGA